MTESETTPLMRQYREIKQAHRDAILFFRVGDFYEMFYEDAETAAGILNIALTSRDKHKADPVPLCGVPHHAAMNYIAKLLKAGRTVALCDQVEDPKLAKGLVRREVVRVYTPGTLIDPELLSPIEAVYLAAVAVQGSGDGPIGLSMLDSSTGEFWLAEFNGPAAVSDLEDELFRLEPRELLFPPSLPEAVHRVVTGLKRTRVSQQEAATFDLDRAQRILHDHFGVASLEGFGCRGLKAGIQAAGAVLHYLRVTQPTARLSHLSTLRVRRFGRSMHLDSATIRNLELVRPLADDRADATLMSVLDRTVSAMGGRLLRDWILHPLLDPGAINARLDAVDALVGDLERRTRIRAELRRVQDLARLSSRLTMGAATPRELVALKSSAEALPGLRSLLSSFHAPLITDLLSRWDDLSDVRHLIEQTIVPDAPATTREGGIIKDGYHADLDELRRTCREGKSWIARLEAEERARTGIDSLKIRFNQVFGYYLEVTKANTERVPDRYIRKQTLANAERFTTQELKELEDRVTGADLKMMVLEQELFERVRGTLSGHCRRLQAMGEVLATLDVLSALAEAATSNRYVRPSIADDGILDIADGRHPVVEQLTTPDGFIPNDVALDLDRRRLIVLTGPNMAGKSTYLRQIALIVLMAQMGGFVPARRAHIGIVDRIFTRVGASDNLAGGQSTFMVEMTETAQILHNATRRSLILLDEIGRGTSTYDGLSIAWAVAEYLLDPATIGARTLFATHYHEMTEFAEQREGARNCTVLVKERDEEVIFLRKIVDGGADRSYGIHVARLAGLPLPVIRRAKEVLARLESAGASSSTFERPEDQEDPPPPNLPTPHPLIEEVRQMELFSMTPLEALNRLADLQRRLADPPR
ncbi:DNA mismatch repair protein MutS [Candidatus Nitrospira bockiana]